MVPGAVSAWPTNSGEAPAALKGSGVASLELEQTQLGCLAISWRLGLASFSISSIHTKDQQLREEQRVLILCQLALLKKPWLHTHKYLICYSCTLQLYSVPGHSWSSEGQQWEKQGLGLPILRELWLGQQYCKKCLWITAPRQKQWRTEAKNSEGLLSVTTRICQSTTKLTNATAVVAWRNTLQRRLWRKEVQPEQLSSFAFSVF